MDCLCAWDNCCEQVHIFVNIVTSPLVTYFLPFSTSPSILFPNIVFARFPLAPRRLRAVCAGPTYSPLQSPSDRVCVVESAHPYRPGDDYAFPIRIEGAETVEVGTSRRAAHMRRSVIKRMTLCYFWRRKGGTYSRRPRGSPGPVFYRMPCSRLGRDTFVSDRLQYAKPCLRLQHSCSVVLSSVRPCGYFVPATHLRELHFFASCSLSVGQLSFDPMSRVARAEDHIALSWRTPAGGSGHRRICPCSPVNLNARGGDGGDCEGGQVWPGVMAEAPLLVLADELTVRFVTAGGDACEEGEAGRTEAGAAAAGSWGFRLTARSQKVGFEHGEFGCCL